MPLSKKKILKYAKGFYGRPNRTIRVAREKVEKALVYSYISRKQKKRVARSEWIMQINAASRQFGIPYGRFMSGMAPAGIQLNRKMLSTLARTEPYSFAAVVHHVQKVNNHWYKQPAKFNVQPIADMTADSYILNQPASKVIEEKWQIPLEVPKKVGPAQKTQLFKTDPIPPRRKDFSTLAARFNQKSLFNLNIPTTSQSPIKINLTKNFSTIRFDQRLSLSSTSDVLNQTSWINVAPLSNLLM